MTKTEDLDDEDEPVEVPSAELAAPPSLADYWQIQIEGVDWTRAFGIWLAGQSKARDFAPGDVYLGASGFHPVYWLSRKRFTPMALGKFLGQPTPTVQLAKTITLKPLAGMDQDQLATVPGFGIA